MTPTNPRLLPRLILLAAAALLALAAWWAVSAWRDWQRGYDPETVVAASLQGLQEQNILVPFTARYVAVVTSTQSRSEEHTSELQSLMRISYAVLCLKKKHAPQVNT